MALELINRNDADVLIIGGGPAGCASAIHLARRGLKVMVFDRQTYPRDKVCGEGIMPHGVRMLDELGILEEIPTEARNWFRGITYIINGAQATGDFPTLRGGYGRGLGVRRTVLDQAARDAALKEGVQFIEKTSVKALIFEDEIPVGLKTKTRDYYGRFIIGADGNRSMTRRRLGLEMPPAKRNRYGVRAHFRYDDPAKIGDTVEVYVTPLAEVYTTPVSENELLVAVLLEQKHMDRFAGRLEEAYEAFFQEDPVIQARFEGGQRISKVMACGPLSSKSKRPITDRALLIGDAAGFIDPITGEGISIALSTAKMASAVIADALTAGDTSLAALVPYERERAQEMIHFKLLTYGLLYLSRFPRLARWAVNRLSNRPELFKKLLGINCGHYTFKDLGVRDVGQLLLG